MNTRTSFTRLSLVLISSTCACITFAQAPDEPSSSRWSVSAGPVVRQFEGGTFRSGSRSATVSLPGEPVFNTLAPSQAGPATGEALRTYDDGFVGPDTAGTTPGSFFEGTTSRFGYDSDSQNNANTTLVFQEMITGEQGLSSSSSSQTALAWEQEPDQETGAIVALSYLLSSPEKTTQILIQGSFLYSSLELQGGGSTFQAERRDTRNAVFSTITDTYEVPTGVILPLAPYSQPSGDPPPGFYPRIVDEPTRVTDSGSTTTSTRNVHWFNQIEESVEADVFTFSLGPQVRIEIAEAGFVSLSGGAALHLVDWRASHEETLSRRTNGGPAQTVTNWKDTARETDVVWGGFAQVSGGLTFGGEGGDGRFFVEGFARWDVTEELDGRVGPSEFTLDLDAFSAGAMAGVTF